MSEVNAKITDSVTNDTVEVTGEQIGESLKSINECLKVLAERLIAVEKHMNELPTPDKTYYKPEGYEEYMNLAGNFTEIYRRLTLVEEKAHPAPSTDHGKRLTALEEQVNGMQD